MRLTSSSQQDFVLKGFMIYRSQQQRYENLIKGAGNWQARRFIAEEMRQAFNKLLNHLEQNKDVIKRAVALANDTKTKERLKHATLSEQSGDAPDPNNKKINTSEESKKEDRVITAPPVAAQSGPLSVI